MEKMTFKTDRTSLDEGEVITVEWDCLDAERVELSIDNGYRASVVPLDKAGTKRFRLNRSKGRTRLTITAWVGEKSYSKTIKVRVHEMRTVHAETVGDDYATQAPRKGLGAKWHESRLRRQAAWQAMTPDKKVASRTLTIIAVTLLLSLAWPRLLLLGLLVVVCYLAWYIRRK